jgi:hypothetical protein
MSNDDRKLSKAEALRGLMADLEAERLQEEAESMTEEELIAAEKADGSHEAMERAYANVDKMFEKARAEQKPPSKVRDIGSARRWSTMSVVAAATTAFTLAAGLVLMLGKFDQLPDALYPKVFVLTTAAAVPPQSYARQAFDSAARTCALDQYAECLKWLDEAKSADPNMVDDPRFQYLHDKAARELSNPKTPSPTPTRK